MFICVWKRMRIMDDNLIARIGIIWASFLSIWMSLTGFEGERINKSRQLCLGDFTNGSIKADGQEIVRLHTEFSSTDLPR